MGDVKSSGECGEMPPMAKRPATVIDNERRAFYRLYLQVKRHHRSPMVITRPALFSLDNFR
jgi:hypothetical protein